MKNKKILNTLADIAKRSPKVGNARVVAALVRRNKILAIGRNSKKSSVMARRFQKHGLAQYDHAEINALYAYLTEYNKKNLCKCTMYVCRVVWCEGKWRLANAAPCDGCRSALQHFNIRRIVFS